MNSTDTDHGIKSELIDLSSVSFDHLKDLTSPVLNHAMNRVLQRTSHLRGGRRSNEGGGSAGERLD